jgi:hypothetical protein
MGGNRGYFNIRIVGWLETLICHLAESKHQDWGEKGMNTAVTFSVMKKQFVSNCKSFANRSDRFNFYQKTWVG